MNNEIQYLNTDLDLVSDDDVGDLVNAFKIGGAYVLSAKRFEDGKWHAVIDGKYTASRAGNIDRIHDRDCRIALGAAAELLDALHAAGVQQRLSMWS